MARCALARRLGRLARGLGLSRLRLGRLGMGLLRMGTRMGLGLGPRLGLWAGLGLAVLV